ncbi:hypothetical protein [Nitrospira sp. Nam74]
MRSALTALAVMFLLILGVGCAGTLDGIGFYGTTGYYPPLYADPFYTPGFPTHPYRYGPGFGPPIYSSPFYYPPRFFPPYRTYPHRYGWHGPRHHHRR